MTRGEIYTKLVEFKMRDGSPADQATAFADLVIGEWDVLNQYSHDEALYCLRMRMRTNMHFQACDMLRATACTVSFYVQFHPELLEWV